MWWSRSPGSFATLAYPRQRAPPTRTAPATAARGTPRSSTTGLDRLEGKATPGQSTSTADPARHPPALGLRSPQPRASANGRSRSGLPRPGACSTVPGPCRATNSGLLVLAALLLGLPALACELLERRRGASGPTARAAAPARGAQAAVGAGGTGAVDGAGRGPLQPDGPPASALHREHHARRGGDARDRARVGLRAPHPRAPGGARGLPDRRHDLRRAAAVRHPAGVVGGDRWARSGRSPWPPSPAREGAPGRWCWRSRACWRCRPGPRCGRSNTTPATPTSSACCRRHSWRR